MNPAYLSPLLGLAFTFLILRRRERVAIDAGEGAAALAFALLGTIQGAMQAQINFDDWGFTALYLAVIAFLGARRGPFCAVVGTTLSVSVLLLVATTHPLDVAVVADSSLGGLVLAQWVTLWITLVGVGVAAAVLARWSTFAVFLAPYGFILFSLTHQPELLSGVAPWLASTLGAGLVLVMSAAFLPGRPTLNTVESTVEAG